MDDRERERELIARAKVGDNDAYATLTQQYAYILRHFAKQVRLPGAEFDDAYQAALIGLWNAVRYYDLEVGTPFRAFLSVCVERNVISGLKAATRVKHTTLNTAVSTDALLFDSADSTLTLADVLPDPARSASDVVAEEELAALVRRAICCEAHLSEFEAAVLLAYMKGGSYSGIAAALARPVKSIDNALQRILAKCEPVILDAIAQHHGQPTLQTKRSKAPANAEARQKMMHVAHIGYHVKRGLYSPKCALCEHARLTQSIASQSPVTQP